MFRSLLFPFSLLYGFGAIVNRFLYESGIRKVYTLPRPVVSVGNLSVGGTGKTPITIAIAEFFKSVGLKPVVLSRGYRRKSKEIKVCKKDSSVEECGDEPVLMAKKDVSVVVGRDRVSASKVAILELNPDIFILDDGFQHHRIKKDINLLLIDATTPFWEDSLLPSGNLREPKGFYRYADCILITRIERLKDRESFLEKVEKLKKPFFFTYEKVGMLYNQEGEYLKVEDIKGKSVIVMAGLGNNLQFFKTVERLSQVNGFKIESFLSFPDHYDYREFRPISGKIYITTEKDVVKIRDKNVYALQYSIEISPEFYRFMLQRLNLDNLPSPQ